MKHYPNNKEFEKILVGLGVCAAFGVPGFLSTKEYLSFGVLGTQFFIGILGGSALVDTISTKTTKNYIGTEPFGTNVCKARRPSSFISVRKLNFIRTSFLS